jgi:hypothetical protein
MTTGKHSEDGENAVLFFVTSFLTRKKPTQIRKTCDVAAQSPPREIEVLHAQLQYMSHFL